MDSTEMLEPRTHEEYQYLDLVKRVMDLSADRPNRTAHRTKALFGERMSFSLENGTVPLLTTKLVNWHAIVEELLWFLRGDTNAKHLAETGVHIWDANTAATNGDCGPMYGWNWRHFGATYEGCDANYDGKGVDQFANVLRLLKTDPFSRRILMTAYNPKDAHLGVLDPCHMMVQFFVEQGTGDGSGSQLELSCCMYQRSADMGLGVPFNIASYALLTHLIAHAVGMKAKRFVHMLGDTHVYENHFEALEEQLKRQPKAAFPKVQFRNWPPPPSLAATPLEAFRVLGSTNIALVGYDSHPAIFMKMAV
jgi:thymidylate synthase